jgi:ABC-type amino acid transport system permease subunit
MFSCQNRGLNMRRTIFGDSAWLGLPDWSPESLRHCPAQLLARGRPQPGQPFSYVLTGLAMILVLPILGLVVAGWPITFDYPVLGGFNFSGGTVIIPEFMALLVALSIYTASFIAEIVRAGIQAVAMSNRGCQHGDAERHYYAAGGYSSGYAGDHSPACQPIPEPDKELFAGGSDRLSRFCSDRRHGFEPNRTGR